MTQVLEYIKSKIQNINKTIFDDNKLKQAGIYRNIQYVAKNPSLLNGGNSRYLLGKSKFSKERLLPATYGMSLEFLKEAKKHAETNSKNKKEKVGLFRSAVCSPSGATEKDVRDMCDKLLDYSDFDNLARAIVNSINYSVLNYGLIDFKERDFGKMFNNMTFEDLPYGRVEGVPGELFSMKNTLISDDDLERLMLNISPVNFNFTDWSVPSSLKILKAVYNKDRNYLYLTTGNQAKGFIKNTQASFNINEQFDCSPVGIVSKTDPDVLQTANNLSVNDATRYKIENSGSGCSGQELDYIQQQSDLVYKLKNDTNFIQIENIVNRPLQQIISNSTQISRNFIDSDDGKKSISIKLYMNKSKDIFGIFRSVDLYLALTCAGYLDEGKDVVSFFFNPATGDLYVVNKNQEQYGYCRAIPKSKFSNCDQFVYVELYQQSLTKQEKYELFVDTDVLPVLLESEILSETQGLEAALKRQTMLLSIDDDDIFFDLFLRNIQSYVYSYCARVKNAKGQIVWQTKPSPRWGRGNWYHNKKNGWQYEDPNYHYVYQVQETFWQLNQEMTIPEVLAYFVSKGGSKHNNSIYYRKLSQRILGVDYYPFSKKIIPALLERGLLCIENLEYDDITQTLKQIEFTYKYEYASNNVYRKMKELEENKETIKIFYGDEVGSRYIDNQYTILQNAKPKELSLGNTKDKTLNLTLNIHNPIFYDKKIGFVSRIAEQTETLRDGALSLSTHTQDFDRSPYIDLKAASPNDQIAYVQSKNHPSKNNNLNHLESFVNWLNFGEGGGLISKPNYMNEQMIIDGYVYPMTPSEFIIKFVMPSFSDKTPKGKNISCPLKFKTPKTGFSPTNLYKNSKLTEESLINLHKIGKILDVDDDGVKKVIRTKKEEVVSKSGKKYTKTHKYYEITELEGKKLYEIIVARYQKLSSEIQIEGNNLFSIFCQTQLESEYRAEIEYKWNSNYNNLAIADYKKFPVFCEHSRWFGDMPDQFIFEFRAAQKEGMKFCVAGSNAGLLAHEVGFGKTTTAIGLLSHMNLTGEALRNIIFCPKSVYENFDDEIRGRKETGVLGLLGRNYNVVKMDNASRDVLMGKSLRMRDGKYSTKGPSLKKYSQEEYALIFKFQQSIDLAKETLRKLPMKHARFWMNDKQSDAYNKSHIQDWWKEYQKALYKLIPEVEDSIEAQALIQKLDKKIRENELEVEQAFAKYKGGERYTANDFFTFQSKKHKSGKYYWVDKLDKAKLNIMPRYIRKWIQDAIKEVDKNNRGKDALSKRRYSQAIWWRGAPQKLWVSDIDGALELKVINAQEAQALKDQKSKNKNFEWDGMLNQRGLNEMRKFDTEISNRFFDLTKKNGQVVRILGLIYQMLIDDLGVYKSSVLEPNSVVLCSHEAVKRFRVSQYAIDEAKKYVSNVDDLKYVSDKVNNIYNALAEKPLSLMKLNVSGIIVDEIHNYNNLIGAPRTNVVAKIPEKPGGKTNHLYLLPTVGGNALMGQLPDGHNVNTRNGVDGKASHKLTFNSKGATDLKPGPTNLMSIVFQVQKNAYDYTKKSKNSVVLSATPFTDNVFQMFSVIGMTNVEKMKTAHIEKVWDFFITFVKEEWRFNITHKNKFGLFAEIQGYYNTFAMSNFIKSFSNFKISDPKIEEKRPTKYVIPQSKGSRYTGGTNTSSLTTSPLLEDVDSYVELTDVQKDMISTIAKYVEGEIDNKFQICPNYKDAETKGVEGLTSAERLNDDEAIKKQKAYKKLLKEAQKETDAEKEYELLDEAYDIVDSLLDDYPDDFQLIKQRDKLTTIMFGEEDVKEDEKKQGDFYIDTDAIGVLALDEKQVRQARAIIGQSHGQQIVLSPYLVKCDEKGDLPNETLKDYPLYNWRDVKKRTQTAKNYVEQSPKIKYAIECALNSISYNAQDTANSNIIGGQILYLNRGKNFRYAGNNFNAFHLIKQYILDKNFTYMVEGKKTSLKPEEIAIITGGMPSTDRVNKQGEVISRGRESVRDDFNKGKVKILIGSDAIKEGINLHKRSHTMYILDASFSPSTAMQLEGRIWRQGNMWKNVRIVYVLGKDSIDAFIYSKLQQKINTIKQMLESGVYEMNKTQFTIDARERIKKIITNVSQLTEMEWQDHSDFLADNLSNLRSDKTKLDILNKSYQPTLQKFKVYTPIINKLYEVVVDNNKKSLIQDVKSNMTIDKLHQYRLKSASQNAKWKRENPFKPVSDREAFVELDKRIKNNEIKLTTQPRTLTENSDMAEVNLVVDRVRKALLFNQRIIQAFDNSSWEEKQRLMNIKEERKSYGNKLATTLFNLNIIPETSDLPFGSDKRFSDIIAQVSLFSRGRPYEAILSSFDLLIKNKEKGENSEGEIIYYEYRDIIDLIAMKEKEISDVKKELGSEMSWKARKYKMIENELEDLKNTVGVKLKDLIENFEKSMPLLKIR